MGKGLRQAIALEAAVLACAVAFLLLFLRTRLGHGHPVLNLVLVALGVILAGLLLAALWRRTLERERMVRRFYVSDHWIYNHEIGFAPMERIAAGGDAFGFVTFAADALARMSYGFEVANPPSEFSPTLVIDSPVFLFHEYDDEGDGEDGEVDRSVVVDEWAGLLRSIPHDARSARDFTDLGEFGNAAQLARLLEDNGAFDAVRGQGVGV